MSAKSPSKKIIIIAGPNRAGKTTFVRSFLPAEAQLPRFINAAFYDPDAMFANRREAHERND